MFSIKCFVFNPMTENSYILYNETQEAIIIDPGMFSEKEKGMIEQFFQANNLTPRFLINTHCHLDHVFGNKWVGERYNLTLHIHAKEQQMLDRAPKSGEQWGMVFDNYSGEIQYLEEGEKIVLGPDILEVLFTPGHSPGSISFYCNAQNFVIDGDVLFYESIGRTDFPGCSHPSLIESIRKKLFRLPLNTIVYPGHGKPTTIQHEIEHNPFLQ